MHKPMTALDKHIQLTGRAEALVNELALYIADHGEVAPDDVTWANVGTMGDVVMRLANTLEAVGHEVKQ